MASCSCSGITSIPRLRREGRDEGVGGAALPVRELGLLRRAELGDQANVWKIPSAVSALQLLSVSRRQVPALPLTRSSPATQSTRHYTACSNPDRVTRLTATSYVFFVRAKGPGGTSKPLTTDSTCPDKPASSKSTPAGARLRLRRIRQRARQEPAARAVTSTHAGPLTTTAPRLTSPRVVNPATFERHPRVDPAAPALVVVAPCAPETAGFGLRRGCYPSLASASSRWAPLGRSPSGGRRLPIAG